jgi:hypothetical protein
LSKSRRMLASLFPLISTETSVHAHVKNQPLSPAPVTRDGADTRKNLTPCTASSPAIALASLVLPVPEGPQSRTPLGGSTPRCLYISG